MADVADLETNLLQFQLKSFGFDRIVEHEGQPLAVFERTETESESQFRPKIVKLRVVIPPEWVIFDLAADTLFLGRDGKTPGPRGSGSAIETAAEKTHFVEQGITWQRAAIPDVGLVYMPAEIAEGLLSEPGRRWLAEALSTSRA
ncbi:MAG: hypothetical protein WCA77_02625 [Thermoplasmata archaeon]